MYRDADEYFDWICDQIKVEEQTLHWYEVLWVMANTDFYAINPMDENRIEDALDLRMEYWADRSKMKNVEYEPASVLEVLVALARRGERDIMHDPDYGDRSSVWFWIMVENLGLCKFAGYGTLDSPKMRNELDEILRNFVDRRYDRAGNGAIFRSRSDTVDMRKEELWRQMNYFFDEFF